MNIQTTHAGGSSTIGLIVVGETIRWLTLAQPWLASVSYLAAIAVAIVTIYYKFKNKK